MTPQELCKNRGLSLAELHRISGVSKQTLTNWAAKKPQVFRCILEGAVKIRRDELR